MKPLKLIEDKKIKTGLKKAIKNPLKFKSLVFKQGQPDNGFYGVDKQLKQLYTQA